MNAVWALFRRELALSWSRGGGPVLSLGFFAATVTIAPLAAGPSPARLSPIAEGVTWVALVLASLLSLDRLFQRDFDDGALDLLALGPAPMAIVATIKCLAQWIVVGAPVALAAPPAAIALGAAPYAAPIILAAALPGSLALAFVGGAGASLALASRRGGILIALIVLPLIMPPVIFGGAAIWASGAGLDAGPALALLCAYALAAVALAPLVMAAACRVALG